MGESEIYTPTAFGADAGGWRTTFLVLAAASLLAIWPLPNTIALRQLLLVAGALVATTIVRSSKSALRSAENWNIWVFFSFFIWLGFHYIVLSSNREDQWHELKSDWARALLASLIGLSLGLMVRSTKTDQRGRLLIGVFIAGLAGTVAIYLARYLIEVARTGQAIHTDFYMVPYLGKTPLVVFGSMLLCGLFSKLSTDLSAQEKKVWHPLSVLVIVCVGVTYYFSNTKNGFIVFILIFLFYAFRLVRARKRGWTPEKWVGALIFLALVGFLEVHIDTNPAWLNFYADIKAGHDIEHNQNWKNAAQYPLPINDQGEIANASTYERSAWATAGAILVQEHPLGYGLINHSFGALALQKWSDFYKPIGKYRHASHSAWLDFTLGFGIPGLALVMLPLWVAFYRASGQTGFWFEWVRWSVPVLTLVYAITEVCTAHFIEFLFFNIALVSGITARKTKP